MRELMPYQIDMLENWQVLAAKVRATPLHPDDETSTPTQDVAATVAALLLVAVGIGGIEETTFDICQHYRAS